jgi:23S rRNA pseudouridine2604 synthase
MLPDPSATTRLNKRMAELGLCSRREADEWIAQGLVRVDGRGGSELGSRVRPHQHITVAPEAALAQGQRVTVLLHKPLGYVSGQAEDGHEPAVVLVTPGNRWGEDRTGLRFARAHLRHLAPAGRLDIDSTGLLVLTQDGRIAKQLVGERSAVEKEYLVCVRWADPDRAHAEFGAGDLMHAFPAERLERLRHGLELDGKPLEPAKVSWQNETTLRFALHEGRRRQIRRMCEAVGLAVVALQRVRIGRVALGRLPPGQWRYLGPFERF